ncbi:hypothetical protein FOZ63_009348, partial [Perkinsus olseni]
PMMESTTTEGPMMESTTEGPMMESTTESAVVTSPPAGVTTAVNIPGGGPDEEHLAGRNTLILLARDDSSPYIHPRWTLVPDEGLHLFRTQLADEVPHETYIDLVG